MRKQRIKVIKIDDGDRVYIYPRKIVYKKRVNGKLIPKFIGVSINDLLESTVIDSNVKEKLMKLLKKSSSFLIGV